MPLYFQHGVGPYDPAEDPVIHRSYYQWVPIVLFFQVSPPPQSNLSKAIKRVNKNIFDAFYCLDLSIPRQIYKYLLQESCNKTSMRPDLLSGLLVLRSPLDV